MLDVRVIHKTSEDSLPTVLSEGLRYGEEGSNSQDERVRETNEFLNGLCPGDLTGQGVDRRSCIYCYLGVDDELIFDVDSGRVVELHRWDPGAGNAALRLLGEPETAFVSDLDAFDAMLDRVDARAGRDELAGPAAEYWRRVVRLDDVRDHYRLEGEALVAAGTAPSHLPRRLERVEVLVTVDVAKGEIEQL